MAGYWWEEPRAPEKPVPEEIVWARDTPAKYPQPGEMTSHGIVPEMPEWVKAKRGRKPHAVWVGGGWRWQMPIGGGRKLQAKKAGYQSAHPHTVQRKLEEYKKDPNQFEKFEEEPEAFRKIVKTTEPKIYRDLQVEKYKKEQTDRILSDLEPAEKKEVERELEKEKPAIEAPGRGRFRPPLAAMMGEPEVEAPGRGRFRPPLAAMGELEPEVSEAPVVGKWPLPSEQKVVVPAKPWWQTASELAEIAFYPFTLSGMTFEKAREQYKEGANIWEQVNELRAKPETPENLEKIRKLQESFSTSFPDITRAKEWLPGGERYEYYKTLPWYEQIYYELPAWLLLGAVGGATGLKAKLSKVATQGGITGTAAQAAQLALAPMAGYEWAVGKAISFPIKGVSLGTNQILNATLKRNARYLSTLARRPSKNLGERTLQKILNYHSNWLTRKSDAVVKAQLAARLAANKGVAEKAAEKVAQNKIKLLDISAKATQDTSIKIMQAVEAGEALTVESLKGLIVKGTPAAFTEGLRSIIIKVGAEVAKEIPVVISASQHERLVSLGIEKLLLTKNGEPTSAFLRLTRGLIDRGKVRVGEPLTQVRANPVIDELTSSEADTIIDALGRLEVKYGKPPKIPITTGLITKQFADKIPFLKEIGILEKIRPTRIVFEKMGLRAEVLEPAFEAEVKIYEDVMAFREELRGIEKLVGRSPARRKAVFEALENPEKVKGLSESEIKAVGWFKEYFNKWADKLDLPASKRRDNYITHIFEAEISQMLKAKHPLDPELIKALDFITPKTIFNPFLQQRLGQKIGLIEDPFRAASAYTARQLKVYHYEPLIQKMRVYKKYLPPNSSQYLTDYINRITSKPLKGDRLANQTLKEFGEKIAKLKIPGATKLAQQLTRGNAAGLIAYQYTSLLYTLWLGFKPTSAIRNLGQNVLTIAEVDPVNFSRGLKLGLTIEGKKAISDSLMLRSRHQAFIPGIDSSFADRWGGKVREASLKMFRQADKVNVTNAFLAGYAEAKHLGLPREWCVKRGDEVAADTQYAYTKLSGAAWSQNALGRTLSPLSTWPENFVELMGRWVKGRPSYVFREYAEATGQKVEPTSWLSRHKAMLLYMTIMAGAYQVKEKTRLRAWEYAGWSSLGYLARILSGEIPALQLPGAVLKTVIGAVTDNQWMLKESLSQLKPTKVLSIAGQIEKLATGETDWLSMLLYLKGKDFMLNKLDAQWSDDFDTYYKSKDHYEYRKNHPEIDAQLFITSRVTTLQSDKARELVPQWIEKYNIDTELIDGYERLFGVDIKAELIPVKEQIGQIPHPMGRTGLYPKEVFTVKDFASEIDKLEGVVGRGKLQQAGMPLVTEYLLAKDQWQAYFDLPGGEARDMYRTRFPDIEAQLFFWGHFTALQNPDSAAIVLELMEEHGITPEGVRAFAEGKGFSEWQVEMARNKMDAEWSEDFTTYYAIEESDSRIAFREENPKIDAELFVSGKVTVCKTYKAEQIVLELMEKHNLEPHDIRAFPEIKDFTDWQVEMAIHKVWAPWAKDIRAYYEVDADDRLGYREVYPMIDAKLFIAGKLTSLRSAKAEKIVLELMEKNNIAPGDIRAFAENMDKYYELIGEKPPEV